MKTLLTIAFSLLFVTGAMAYPVSTNFFDFDDKSDMFDYNNNWSPIDFNKNGIEDDTPSPFGTGIGGELFDFEGVFMTEDDDNIYIGVTSTSGWSYDKWNMGDLWITTANGNTYAIDVTNDMGDAATDLGLYYDPTAMPIPVEPGGYGYDSYIADEAGPFELSGGDMVDYVTGYATYFEEGFEDNPMHAGETYGWFHEYSISKSLLDNGDYGYLGLSQTYRCGNDKFEYNPVPEPTTIALFGLGLLGAGIARRRAK